MLVYGNHLRLQGEKAEEVVLRAIRRWLEEQLDSGLHPKHLTRDGTHPGHRGKKRSHLRVYSCYDGDPALCAWVLKHPDEGVWGRQWIAEVGVKKTDGTLEVSCVVRAEDGNTLVQDPVNASQPRVVRYILQNALAAEGVDFVTPVTSAAPRTVGRDHYSYQAFLEEIEWSERDRAIVLMSATREGEYLLDEEKLREKLVGLAEVVQVLPQANTYEMEEILGPSWSAWHGAVNVLSIPSPFGAVRYRRFLADEIRSWGDDRQRSDRILEAVTANTNGRRRRHHIQPRGVMLEAVRRRMARTAEDRLQMSDQELRDALAKQEAAYEETFEDFAEVNDSLENELARYKDYLDEANDQLRSKDFQLRSLQESASSAGPALAPALDPTPILQLLALKKEPSPSESLEIIEKYYGERCVVLPAARSSSAEMTRFTRGRKLLRLLLLLVTEYRDEVRDGGTNTARRVFGDAYSAQESETTKSNKELRGRRKFEYRGEPVVMLQHLGIGRKDDVTETIRVHFHWDAERRLIVIGHCGKHLPLLKALRSLRSL